MVRQPARLARDRLLEPPRDSTLREPEQQEEEPKELGGAVDLPSDEGIESSMGVTHQRGADHGGSFDVA